MVNIILVSHSHISDLEFGKKDFSPWLKIFSLIIEVNCEVESAKQGKFQKKHSA